MKQERIIYEEQPFHLLARISKPRENEFGTCYLVKLAVVGAVCGFTMLLKAFCDKGVCALQIRYTV